MATNPELKDIDARISIVRNNIRELVAQASGHSGAADDELLTQRILEQERQLDTLTKLRASLG